MKRRPRQKPVTLKEIESWLDFLAEHMEWVGPQKALLYLPIWRALIRERDARIEAETILSDVKARLQARRQTAE